MPALPALAIGAAGLAGAAISSSAAKNAANTQAAAETSAAATQKQMYDETAARLAPFTTAGTTATSQIQNTAPFSFGSFNFQPTESQLEQTPGYQFNLTQGEKSVQNSYAAKGLGTSGAALKGAETYASGLADSTYQNQFSNALNSYQANYGTAQGQYNTNLSRLQNLANTGENAAAQTGAYGTQTAANIGQTAVGAANASAAGTVGSANAISGGLGSVSNAYLLNSFYGGGGQNAGSFYTGSPTTSDVNQTAYNAGAVY